MKINTTIGILLCFSTLGVLGQEAKTTVHEKQGRKVTIVQLTPEQVEAEIEKAKEQKAAEKALIEEATTALKKEGNKKSKSSKKRKSNGGEEASQVTPTIQKSYVVFATVCDDGSTLVKCWSADEGEAGALSVHSNFDWQIFEKHQSFQDGEVYYSFILLPAKSSDSAVGAPEVLPNFKKAGPRYTLVEGNETDDDKFAFLESIHARYDREKNALDTAYQERQAEAAQREHQVESFEPEEVTIRFGRRETK